ncbi:hypothetical protein LguiB_035256 [Lonicera macranthoides]
MELVLNANHAGDWVYRGEGACNLVLAYTGSSPYFIGKVLRVQKVARNGSKLDDGPSTRSKFEGGPSILTMYERLLWEEIKDLVLAPTRELAEQEYVQHVMSPLLGSEHVDVGLRVLVAREFLESVENNVLCQRPSWRVDDAKVNTECDSALLISDHSVFPRGVVKEDFCISVEIKPKCGFLPLSSFIAEENNIKRSVTRFKMHQALKLQQGKILQISEYDPLDLFSGSSDRVHKAIKALYVTPQNNFRVFLNGTLIFGDMDGGADFNSSCLTREAFEDALKGVIAANDGMRAANFLQLVAGAAFRSGLLERLLEAQKLDNFDIEGAIHAYYDVVSQPCVVCGELGEGKRLGKYSSLHSIPTDESLKIVRDYLISATAKDLSIIFGFRPRQNGDLNSLYDAVLLESANQTFDYKASFIDLDMKPLKKMEFYYELDQEIVNCYNHKVKIEHQSNNAAASIEETSYRDQTRSLEDIILEILL